jgi:hypothetical protein
MTHIFCKGRHSRAGGNPGNIHAPHEVGQLLALLVMQRYMPTGFPPSRERQQRKTSMLSSFMKISIVGLVEWLSMMAWTVVLSQN